MSSNEPPTYPRPDGEEGGPSYPGQEPTPPGAQQPPEQPPQPPPGPPGPPGYGPPPPGYQQPAGAYGGGGQQNQKALWSMILGIVSVVLCWCYGAGILPGIPAIILGHMAKKDIDATGDAQSGRGMAQAGFILGIVGVVLSVASLAAIAVFIGIGISNGEFTNTEF